jgi:hypothetical protein
VAKSVWQNNIAGELAFWKGVMRDAAAGRVWSPATLASTPPKTKPPRWPPVLYR